RGYKEMTNDADGRSPSPPPRGEGRGGAGVRGKFVALSRCARFFSSFVICHSFLGDRKSTRLNSSHLVISYAVFCLKKKKITKNSRPLTSTIIHVAYFGRPLHTPVRLSNSSTVNPIFSTR